MRVREGDRVKPSASYILRHSWHGPTSSVDPNVEGTVRSAGETMVDVRWDNGSTRYHEHRDLELASVIDLLGRIE